MKLKRLLVSLLVALTVCTSMVNTVSPIIVEAHSGRTDSRGGHKDNRNKSGLGSYHYHHGYPAHLHTNGVCPYENGYPTSSSSSSSGSLSTNSNNTSYSNTTDSNIVVVQNDDNVGISSNTNNTENATIIISDTSYDNVAFNASYYANKHIDVYQACGDNAKALYDHFIVSGIFEGRQSSAQFNISVYKQNNPDLVSAFGDDLIKYYNHFIKCGYNEGRVSK